VLVIRTYVRRITIVTALDTGEHVVVGVFARVEKKSDNALAGSWTVTRRKASVTYVASRHNGQVRLLSGMSTVISMTAA
jgi:hypothetical protein